MGNNDSRMAGCSKDSKVAGMLALVKLLLEIKADQNVDRNAAIKLIFPSHGLPFAIPYSVLPVRSPGVVSGCRGSARREWMLHELKIGTQDLVSKIDEILKDMEKKTADPRGSRGRKLPSGKILESPSPGDWVLIDVDNSQLIHNSVMAIQVVEGGTYLVLPMRGSDISEEDLKEAIKAVRTTTRPADDLLPSYSSG